MRVTYTDQAKKLWHRMFDGCGAKEAVLLIANDDLHPTLGGGYWAGVSAEELRKRFLERESLTSTCYQKIRLGDLGCSEIKDLIQETFPTYQPLSLCLNVKELAEYLGFLDSNDAVWGGFSDSDGFEREGYQVVTVTPDESALFHQGVDPQLLAPEWGT